MPSEYQFADLKFITVAISQVTERTRCDLGACFTGTAGRTELEFRDLFRKIIGFTVNCNHRLGGTKGWDGGG